MGAGEGRTWTQMQQQQQQGTSQHAPILVESSDEDVHVFASSGRAGVDATTSDGDGQDVVEHSMLDLAAMD